jgi:hypothetical protein
MTIAQTRPREIRYARGVLEDRWPSLTGKLGIVSGKTAISRISEWAQDSFGISLTAYLLARALLPAELDAELVSIMKAIEFGSTFPP